VTENFDLHCKPVQKNLNLVKEISYCAVAKNNGRSKPGVPYAEEK